MTEVSEAMFPSEPWALSMRITASEVFSVWQPARPTAARTANIGISGALGARKDRDEENKKSAIRALSPCVMSEGERTCDLQRQIKKAAATPIAPANMHLKTSK